MTELSVNMGWLLSSFISLLLSMLVFFIRQLYNEFKKMELNVAEIKITTEVIKANMSAESLRIGERIHLLEKRTELLEGCIRFEPDGKRKTG